MTLINAAVSHELRNPLNSLIGQINSMEGFFENFQYLKSELQNMNGHVTDEKKFKKIVKALGEVYSGLKTCGKKMTSSAMFIDYFVHDILDFSILNKEGAKFTKDLNVFSIKDTVN